MVLEKEDKLILITNDDGLYAAGLGPFGSDGRIWEGCPGFDN